MSNKTSCSTLLLTGSLAAATAGADYLAPDPGTQISIQYNAGNVIVVRPVGGVWSHSLCPDVTTAVLSPAYFPAPDGSNPQTTFDFKNVWELLVQAATNGRSVNLRVSETACHPKGYPLIESLRIFP